MLPRFVLYLWLVQTLLALGAHAGRGDERHDFFEAKIRPILSGTCFRCHGDAKTSGGLRIDSRASLVAGGESGAALMPGNPDASLLIQAIRRQEGVSAMPPEKEKALRADQIADFATWIKSGAAWPEKSPKFESAGHWAFAPIRHVAPPSVRDKEWSHTSLDPYILARHEAAGVRAAPPADRLTLIRRATFDLTGLPPTAAEVEAFLQDSSPLAFEAVVERLLASPAYGERWGRHWLDVVRYADTAGETADYPVPAAWRYRNYVIDALNADKPYDEFLREQIAGDIFAAHGPSEKYAEQVTATGFLAISRRFGFDSENYHHLTIQDTIDTLGQTVLGLSLGCARCHDHKFDAVSMRDYYALYGIFESSRYAFPGSEQKQKVRSLAPLIPPTVAQPKWREFEARLAAGSAVLARLKQPVPAAVLRSLGEFDGDFELQAPAAGGSKGVLVPPWRYEGNISVTAAAQSPFKNLYQAGKVGVSILPDAAGYRMEQAIYPLRTTESCEVVRVNLDFRVTQQNDAVGHHVFAIGATGSAPVVELLISADELALRSGDEVERLAPLKPGEWQNLQLTLHLKERTVAGQVGKPDSNSQFSARPFARNSSGAVGLVMFDSTREGKARLPAIEFDNLGVQDSLLSPVSTEPPGVPSAAEPDPVKLKQELETLLAEGPFPLAYAMAEGTPRDARIQLRGEPDQPGEIVPRGFIKVLGGTSLPAGTAGSGRLEFSRWLTRPDNPLTSRVMVNRIWQFHFGRGLVRTPNDFGVRGLPPTHPELLDHLALQFIESGWSLKAMHRLIMQSATYQQASLRSDSDSASESGIDTSDLYVLFPRRRLNAEEIRDSILAVSGELDRRPAREHPFPSPIGWSYTQHTPFSAVYDHNRRGVYLMTQRLKRHPFLALFDGADPNTTTPARLVTTVPTQALYFLNDPFVHANAEKWAGRLMGGAANEGSQIDAAWRTAFGRSPSELERAEAAEFIAAYRAELTMAKLDNRELRALAAYLRTLLGSSAFLHVD